ncbi:hypothetical protein HK101_012055 [Irineochytrium annulatum]|nr:hypothetical protein HK101_012055 [Irineochytrium annulatum]
MGGGGGVGGGAAANGHGGDGYNKVDDHDLGAPPTGNVPLPGTSSDASSINTRALYVGNLPYSIGWQDLKDIFRNAGNVVRTEIPTDYQGRSKGFGTVVMSSVEEARKAVVLYNGHELNGRRIEVREDRTYVEGQAPRPTPTPGGSYAPGYHHNQQSYHTQSYTHQSHGYPTPPNTSNASPMGGGGGGATAGRVLFVGNLPFTVQWQELKDHFRQFGAVQRADVAQDGSGRNRGYGNVMMSTVEEARAAIAALNGSEFQGRVIEVREDKYAGESGGGGGQGGGPAMVGTQVFVGNDLKDLFRPHGLNPIHADVMSEPGTGRSKGCGIVRFASREEAERSVQTVNGTNVAGRNIVVRLDKFA